MAKDFANGFDLVRQAALAAGVIEASDGDDAAARKIAAVLSPEVVPEEVDEETSE